MPTLRLLPAESGITGHSGEVCACAYTPDGQFVLSGGWDGHLRLWETTNGTPVTGFRAGDKPIAACAASPDGKHWLSGSLEGLLAVWESVSQRRVSMFLAHTRPISTIVFAPDGRTLATASWDRSVTLWNPNREREGRTLAGHGDIVAGCRFTPDGERVLTWSHDKTLRLWEAARGRMLCTLATHEDRVTAAGVSPDGRRAVSGSRDGALKLWDLAGQKEEASAFVKAEVKACFFLLDGEAVVSVDAHGRMTVHGLDGLEEQSEVSTRLAVQSAELSPLGSQAALACDDGRVHFVAVEGCEEAPLVVAATQTSRRTATGLQKLFGRSKVVHSYSGTCPACRHPFEFPVNGAHALACAHCRRRLRIAAPREMVPERVR